MFQDSNFKITSKEELLDKCVEFAIKINKLRKYLREKQHEYNNSDQIQRSGTSIGANYSEACNAVSTADFVNKLAIAQKEAHETIYWLRVLYGSELISKESTMILWLMYKAYIRFFLQV